MDGREQRKRNALAEIERGYADALARRAALEATGSVWAWSWARACEERWRMLLRESVIMSECGGW